MASQARKSSGTKQRRLRRQFDRAVALARFRWEILRRTDEYKGAFQEVLQAIAKTMREKMDKKWSDNRLEQHCRNEEVLTPVSGEGLSSREHYYNVCERYGLRVLIHPDISFSGDAMGAYPIFVDTPTRQPLVRDRAKLRRVVTKGAKLDVDPVMNAPLLDVSSRTLRRIFSQKHVAAGPYQVQVGRVRLDQLDSMLAVFDRHREGMPFAMIARQLDLKIDQVKRAWRKARSLVENRFDLDSHFKTCRRCQKLIAESCGYFCAVAEAQIGTPRSQSVGSRATPIDQLERDHARHRGELPARRAYKKPPHSEDWAESLLKIRARGRRGGRPAAR
jgi:hypothetical protein